MRGWAFVTSHEAHMVDLSQDISPEEFARMLLAALPRYWLNARELYQIRSAVIRRFLNDELRDRRERRGGRWVGG